MRESGKLFFILFAAMIVMLILYWLVQGDILK